MVKTDDAAGLQPGQVRNWGYHRLELGLSPVIGIITGLELGVSAALLVRRKKVTQN
jgi:hypothetical protein